MLQKDNLTAELQQEYTDSVLHASKRLLNLITNILKMNKLEKQTIQVVSESYDLCRQLSECALLFENSWEMKDIEFNADIEERAVIHGDESLWELVWSNLLSNAIKFTESGGTVEFTQTFTEKEITVSVTDTGCGMSKETAQHIFDKFYQGDTSRSTEGNGLGLALVRRIIELMDGSIDVTS